MQTDPVLCTMRVGMISDETESFHTCEGHDNMTIYVATVKRLPEGQDLEAIGAHKVRVWGAADYVLQGVYISRLAARESSP